MANLLALTNDTTGKRDVNHKFLYSVAGNLTAATAAPVFMAYEAGDIVDVIMGARTYTATTDRTLSVTVKKVVAAGTATAVCSTNPAFAATAGAASVKLSSNVAGTGITTAVLKTDGSQTLAVGDMVTIDVAVAGANGTIGTDLAVTIVFKPATA